MVAPNYTALIESYQKAQDVTKQENKVKTRDHQLLHVNARSLCVSGKDRQSRT